MKPKKGGKGKKGGRGEDELKQLRAIKAKQNQGQSKDRSAIASKAANERWRKYRDALPKHTPAELAAIQAKRSKRARLLDAKSTSANLLDPNSELTDLWVRDPTHFDVRGLDDEVQADRRRPRKPAKPARKGKDATRGKKDRKASPRPRSKRPAKKDDKAGDKQAPSKRPKKAPAKKEAKPADNKRRQPAKKGAKEAPAKRGKASKGGEKPSIRISTGLLERARDALGRVAKAPEKPGAAPENKKYGPDLAGGRLIVATQQSYDHLAPAKRPLHYDLDKGGFVTSDDGFISVFNTDAPPLTSAQATQASKRTRQRIMARYKGAWKPRLRDAVVVDLAEYLQALQPSPHLEFMPVGDEFYRIKDVKAVAKAMPGPVLLDNGKNRALYLQQGSNVALVRPFDPGNAYTDLATAQRYAVLAGEAGKNAT